jgi:hypothetical protein
LTSLGHSFIPVWLITVCTIGYYIPDAVTWTSSYNKRILFWFEYGIAVQAFAVADDSTFGLIDSIIYFPYQEVEGYSTRWPYSETLKYDTTLPDAPYPTETNPFDFDVFWATITAQPPTLIYTPTALPTMFGTQSVRTETPIP